MLVADVATVPESGRWACYLTVYIQNGGLTGATIQDFGCNIVRNASTIYSLADAKLVYSQDVTYGGVYPMLLTAGDTIKIVFVIGNSRSVGDSTSVYVYFGMSKLP